MSYYLIAKRTDDHIVLCKFTKVTDENVLYDAGFVHAPRDIIANKEMKFISLFINKDFPECEGVKIEKADRAIIVTVPIRIANDYLHHTALHFSISTEVMAEILK